MQPSREMAWELLNMYNTSEALIKHALAVEGVMRHFACLRNGDPELWGIVGLLHDLDYEKYPDQHCEMTVQLLREQMIDEVIVRACASHGFNVCNDIEPTTDMEKVLYTIDELTGLIGAVAIMRPSRSVMDLELKSVMKKYKTRSFAAGCDRALIESGCEMIHMSIEDVITRVIEGMRNVHDIIAL